MNVNLAEDQVIEIIKCARDINYFANNYAWIEIKEQGINVPFRPRFYQEEILEWIQNKECGVIFKSRRIGASTVAIIGAVWMMIFKRDVNILLLSNKENSAQMLLERFKFTFNNLKKVADGSDFLNSEYAGWMRPEVVTSNKSKVEVAFRDDNGNIIGKNVVESLTTTGDSGRGKSATFVFMDELAFLPNDRETFGAATPTTTWGGFWMAASTPNGTDNVFYDLVSNATHSDEPYEDLGYHLLTVHWKDAGITEDMLKTSSKTMSNETYKQEWELEFVQSGTPVFNKLDLDACFKPLDKYSQLREILNEYNKSVLADKMNSKPSLKYFCGVDSAIGKNRINVKGDYHAFTALTNDGIQAFSYHNNTISLSEWAGYVHGNVMKKGMTSKFHEEYPGIFNVEENQSGYTVLNMHITPHNGKSKTESTNTNAKTKALMINNLILAVENHEIIITDPATYDEMLVYQRGQTPGSFEAPKGKNDDLVMALALAWDALQRHGGRSYNLDIDFIQQDSNIIEYNKSSTELPMIGFDDFDLTNVGDFSLVDNFDDGLFNSELHPEDVFEMVFAGGRRHGNRR